MDASGNWSEWTGPWNSLLKLHAAGYLYFGTGMIMDRGVYGNYFSNNPLNNENTKYISFGVSHCDPGVTNKAHGETIRCLLDYNSFSTIPSVTTSPVSDIAQTTSTCGGNVTSDGGSIVTSRGVCWSTTSNPTISDSHSSDGNGTGSYTSSITGLAAGTLYYLRAYATNSAGTAYGSETNFTTAASAFTCGSSLNINHVAGTVAPVSKTVTYGTVTNVPGETTKCWITSNLGADNQATSATDATEAAAGWYWQFNQKQGYKHDGTTLTPAWTITSINESSDWLAANDPCNLLLGADWRLPTYTEWNNVESTGGWSNYNHAYSSLLKLHAAGSLDYPNGSRVNMGQGGIYWSGTQNSSTEGWNLHFDIANSNIHSLNKAYGFSARCIMAPGGTSSLPTVTTTTVSNITQTGATGGGNVTSDGGATVTARGVCWSTSPGPTISGNHTTDGTGTGTFTSSITGLTASTTYYVRAYATNSAGTAYGNEISFSTLSWACGSSITVNHIVGVVAPVSKTISYGTVTNVPGETTKCWITSNLGADHQATSVDDATEASGGWYWQFNRKQGYKHDGSTRTPATSWIPVINENLEWQAAEDPCTIEMGSGWRIPTKTEWFNVDASGNWTTWTDSWNSSLKLHGAGYLNKTDGSLVSRGSDGYAQSSTQYGTTTTDNWYIHFHSSFSFTSGDAKSYGLPVRCINESGGTASVPTVTTTTASNITQTGATGGGNVTSDGGASVTARGVCWGTGSNPTLSGSHTSDGTGTGTFTSSITGLTANTLYYARAYATNSVGTAYGNEVTFTTLANLPTVTTTSITNITQTTATGGGNVTSDGGASVTARGVCWGTSSNPTTSGSHTTDGNGTGTFTSGITGLYANTLYYVRAYATNGVGTAYGNEVSFSTLASTCGSSITVNHVAGAVAPVSKTVTYGIVTNVPGEASKCWITSNLGSDHQATFKNDATEASAGWYWQFNHKQGYKHDGTTRIPNTAWISSFEEFTNWTVANDPCNIELASSWRIPTYSEWYNVDSHGFWNNWDNPWNSLLKLHPAGYLLWSDGSLGNRGYIGDYWSSKIYTTTYAWSLFFGSSSCFMSGDGNSMSFGKSIRCIKD